MLSCKKCSVNLAALTLSNLDAAVTMTCSCGSSYDVANTFDKNGVRGTRLVARTVPRHPDFITGAPVERFRILGGMLPIVSKDVSRSTELFHAIKAEHQRLWRGGVEAELTTKYEAEDIVKNVAPEKIFESLKNNMSAEDLEALFDQILNK